VQSLQAQGALEDFLSDNMIFYCWRVGPKLGGLCERISFLDSRLNIWSLLLGSSVMGQLETQLNAKY
jgi:hypothetical protein